MGNIKEINIKNQTYYFFNDMISIKDFDPSLIKNRQKIIQKHWYLSYWINHNKKY